MIRAVSTQDPKEITVQIEVRARRASVSGCLDVRTGPVLVQTVCAVPRPVCMRQWAHGGRLPRLPPRL
jgi:hypothetical protein